MATTRLKDIGWKSRTTFLFKNGAVTHTNYTFPKPNFHQFSLLTLSPTSSLSFSLFSPFSCLLSSHLSSSSSLLKRYENSTNNDLLYWGLDYPPLTAYHSWLCGVIANSLNPAWVSLGNSRGFENYDIRLFMRYTVLAMDVLVYFTAALVFSNLVYKKKEAVWERVSDVEGVKSIEFSNIFL